MPLRKYANLYHCGFIQFQVFSNYCFTPKKYNGYVIKTRFGVNFLKIKAWTLWN